ncbi:MAG: diversity-generating retroelement protein Avd [Patescibacteria group bacterium]|nr:diversity-generating retroelement protein Avd [Patescibacteria group bacterium]
MHDEFILHKKTYELLIWIYPLINRIPKSHRLVLGRKLEEICLDLLLTIIKANKAQGKERLQLQLQYSQHLDTLRILIRLTKDLKMTSVKQYTLTAKKISELGRMLSGWKKVIT